MQTAFLCQRCIDLQQQRQTHTPLQQGARKQEQVVAFVDDIRLELSGRLHQAPVRNQRVRQFQQLVHRLRKPGPKVLHPANFAAHGGVTSRACGRNNPHLVPEFAQSSDELFDVNCLSVLGRGAVVIENLHARHPNPMRIRFAPPHCAGTRRTSARSTTGYCARDGHFHAAPPCDAPRPDRTSQSLPAALPARRCARVGAGDP